MVNTYIAQYDSIAMKSVYSIKKFFFGICTFSWKMMSFRLSENVSVL